MAHTCIHFFKLLFEVSGRQSVLIQSVIPVDPVQNLQVSPDQPVSTFHHHLKKKSQQSWQGPHLKHYPGLTIVVHKNWAGTKPAWILLKTLVITQLQQWRTSINQRKCVVKKSTIPWHSNSFALGHLDYLHFSNRAEAKSDCIPQYNLAKSSWPHWREMFLSRD